MTNNTIYQKDLMKDDPYVIFEYSGKYGFIVLKKSNNIK